MSRRAALILAGGKGRRFQRREVPWQDKALTPLFGKPLLIHALEKVREVVDEIVVCVNEPERKMLYQQILEQHSFFDVGLVVDEKIDNLSGPLVGIRTGLKFVNSDYCFTLPGDMPLMKPKVIELMFSRARDARVVVPMWPNGRLETLSLVLEKKSGLKIADTLCRLGRPRSDDLIRGALNVIFLSMVSEISVIDPELKSFVNINSPEDLMDLQPRRVLGSSDASIHADKGSLPGYELKQLRKASVLTREHRLVEAASMFSASADRLELNRSLFWSAVSRENEAKNLIVLSRVSSERKLALERAARSKKAFLGAASSYELEADMHVDCGCMFLAERARSDESWCLSRAKEI